MQFQSGVNIGWNSSTANATVQPAKNTINSNTDGVYAPGTQGIGSRTFNDGKSDNLPNLSWNIPKGQVIPRNEDSDLTSSGSLFDVPLTTLSPSGQAIGSCVPLMKSKQILIGAEQTAQVTQPQIRGRGKDHKATSVFPCKECKRTFRGEYELNRHLNETKKHGGPKVECPLCGDLFSRQETLKKHMSNPRACRVK
ncbi:hypothetical protein AX14_008048 [Amanita brunnescens Koide BX004]|nr:hypothetical protein AX14_008048 [Amanita brunnescens Koide BX004]